MEMTRVAFGAKVSLGEGGERDARDDRDPMIAFLPVDRDMRITGFPKGPVGKIAVRALRFLEAQNVGLVFEKKSHNEINAQAHRIDVPCGDGKGHGRLRRRQTATCPLRTGIGGTVMLLHAVGYHRRWLRSWFAGRFAWMSASAWRRWVVRWA